MLHSTSDLVSSTIRGIIQDCKFTSNKRNKTVKNDYQITDDMIIPLHSPNPDPMTRMFHITHPRKVKICGTCDDKPISDQNQDGNQNIPSRSQHVQVDIGGCENPNYVSDDTPVKTTSKKVQFGCVDVDTAVDTDATDCSHMDYLQSPYNQNLSGKFR